MIGFIEYGKPCETGATIPIIGLIEDMAVEE
jgi:hypothetical protein